MEELIKYWPLVVVPTILYCVLVLLASRKLEATYQRLGGRISSEEDLGVLKKAINHNMTLAIIVIVIVLVYLGAIFYMAYAGYFTFLTAAIYMPILPVAGFLCSLLYTKKIEKRAKNMTVTADDPQILETYRRWVKQWDEPRLRLPD